MDELDGDSDLEPGDEPGAVSGWSDDMPGDPEDAEPDDHPEEDDQHGHFDEEIPAWQACVAEARERTCTVVYGRNWSDWSGPLVPTGWRLRRRPTVPSKRKLLASRIERP